MYNECLFRIEKHLQSGPDKEGALENHGLPTPNRLHRLTLEEDPLKLEGKWSLIQLSNARQYKKMNDLCVKMNNNFKLTRQ